MFEQCSFENHIGEAPDYSAILSQGTQLIKDVTKGIENSKRNGTRPPVKYKVTVPNKPVPTQTKKTGSDNSILIFGGIALLGYVLISKKKKKSKK